MLLKRSRRLYKKIENQWQKVEALEQTYAEKSALRKDLEIDIPQEMA